MTNEKSVGLDYALYNLRKLKRAEIERGLETALDSMPKQK